MIQSLGQSGARKLAGFTNPFCFSATLSMYSTTDSVSAGFVSAFLKYFHLFSVSKVLALPFCQVSINLLEFLYLDAC